MGKVGVEFEHVSVNEERDWLYDRYDQLQHQDLTNSERYYINDLLLKSEVFPPFTTTHKNLNLNKGI